MTFCIFSSKSYLLSNLTLINDTTRQQLMKKVPRKGLRGTCIGCGLQTALEVRNLEFVIKLKLPTNGETVDFSRFYRVKKEVS